MQPWRARIAVGAVAALLFGYVLTHRQASPEPAPSPTPSTASTTPAAPTPRPSTVLYGPLRPGPAGLRLYVGGGSPHLRDAHTGAVTPLSVPRASDGRPALLFRSGSALFASVRASRSSEIARIYLVRPGRSAIALGEGETAVAGRHGGPITMRRATVGGERDSVLTGYDAAGRQLWQWHRQWADVRPIIDTRYGLLVHEVTGAARDLGPLLLVDPRTGRLRREVTSATSLPLAADAERVAWLGPGQCTPTCPIRVGSLSDDSVRTLVNPHGRSPYPGAFSPDGRLLALPFAPALPTQGPTDDPDALVEVFGLGGRGSTRLPGYAGAVGSFVVVEWADPTTVLLVASTGPNGARIALIPARPAGPGTLLPWTAPSTGMVGIAP